MSEVTVMRATPETVVEVDPDGIVTMRRGEREVRGIRPYRGCAVALVLRAQEVKEEQEKK